ncbi:hypothetical protein [Sphingobacterium pedocola]|uniref:FabZ n=1 Tax=Sphingobacterium pedocola TaxID=2082722 RepID=A0ABR9T8Q7_9SPHI|nr:hypothetical protein [Sphingobacterium pedocola]MBE8721731.1 hypothetical protein [Sphingobacterium pedocola]
MNFPIHGEQILALIPQRYPIVMVDTLYEYAEDSLLSGLHVSRDTLFVDIETLQECGLLEHMAQSVALHTGFDYFQRNEEAPTGYIGSMQGIELTSLPKVGDVVQTEVQIIQEFMGVTLVNITSKISGEVIGKAQMKTVIASS